MLVGKEGKDCDKEEDEEDEEKSLDISRSLDLMCCGSTREPHQ